jgi:hypothetical protein
MKCERCEHTIAPDSPVWCQGCHDARITDVQDEARAEHDELQALFATGAASQEAFTKRLGILHRERDELFVLASEMWERAKDWCGPTSSSHYRSAIHERLRRAGVRCQ